MSARDLQDLLLAADAAAALPPAHPLTAARLAELQRRRERRHAVLFLGAGATALLVFVLLVRRPQLAPASPTGGAPAALRELSAEVRFLRSPLNARATAAAERSRVEAERAALACAELRLRARIASARAEAVSSFVTMSETPR